jgi:hypothetical protein
MSQQDIAEHLHDYLENRRIGFDHLQVDVLHKAPPQTSFLVHAHYESYQPNSRARIYRITVEAL